MDYTIRVLHQGRSYDADVRPQENCDNLLLRSLHHFRIDPSRKTDWTLIKPGSQESNGRLYLNRSIAGQLDNGERVELRPRDADVREPSTGSY